MANRCDECRKWLNFGNQTRGRCLQAAPLEEVEVDAAKEGASPEERLKVRKHAMTSAGDGCKKDYEPKLDTERKPTPRGEIEK